MRVGIFVGLPGHQFVACHKADPYRTDDDLPQLSALIWNIIITQKKWKALTGTNLVAISTVPYRMTDDDLHSSQYLSATGYLTKRNEKFLPVPVCCAKREFPTYDDWNTVPYRTTDSMQPTILNWNTTKSHKRNEKFLPISVCRVAGKVLACGDSKEPSLPSNRISYSNTLYIRFIFQINTISIDM